MERTHVDLFSGIGGFALAAAANGVKTTQFVEIDPRCRAFLARAWPGIPIHDDVRTLTVDILVNSCYLSLNKSEREVIDMGVTNPRYDEAVALYDKGMSIGDIAAFYEVSRQAMWMILKRRGCEFRDQQKHGTENHFSRGGRVFSARVHDLTERAVLRGILTRPAECSECGVGGAVVAHHDNYNRPLDVRWLCHKCHFDWHKNNRPEEQTRDFPPLSRAEIARMGVEARRKEVVTDEEFQQKLEHATTIDLLTAGVP